MSLETRKLINSNLKLPVNLKPLNPKPYNACSNP